MTAAPIVTAFYGAIIGLLAALLTVNVIRSRVVMEIADGDGGSAPMRMAIRAHANLAQYVALALLLIGGRGCRRLENLYPRARRCAGARALPERMGPLNR